MALLDPIADSESEDGVLQRSMKGPRTWLFYAGQCSANRW